MAAAPKPKLKQIVVSVRRTTKLTLIVPQGLEHLVVQAVEMHWDGAQHFFDGRGHVMPSSHCLIVGSDGVENDALVEEKVQRYTGAAPVRVVLSTWAAMANHSARAEDLAAQANAAREQELAAQDPETLGNLSLIDALKWLYPGNAPGSWHRLSHKKKVAAYREYFARWEHARAEVKT